MILSLVATLCLVVRTLPTETEMEMDGGDQLFRLN